MKTMTDASPHALVSGGGSGGHVFPGLAVAEELARRGWRVSWAGDRRGMESRLVPRRKIPFFALAARPVVGQGTAGKLRAGWTLARSALGARALVRRLDAGVVVGTGGYVSAPAVVGGRLASRPVLLVEPNAEAGLANRLLSRLASEAAVAWDETRSQLRCPAHTTGVPVRAEFFDVPEALPPAPPLRLLILGGSQGAQQLNEMLPRALGSLQRPLGGRGGYLPDLPPIAVLHQAGERNLDATREAYRAAGLSADDRSTPARAAIGVEVVSFLDDVAGNLAGCHLVVSRAGAITLAEICAAGRGALLVPLAIAAGHQLANARRLESAAAAEVLAPGLDDGDLIAALERLLADPDRLGSMARAARSLGRAGAAGAIADRVEHLAEGVEEETGGSA